MTAAQAQNRFTLSSTTLHLKVQLGLKAGGGQWKGRRRVGAFTLLTALWPASAVLSIRFFGLRVLQHRFLSGDRKAVLKHPQSRTC
jgi:hypothetical protein